MIVQQMNVTPTMAAEWLTKNAGNRKLRKFHVRSLSGAMTRGEWRLNHQPIALDAQGNILDGQHRLTAVITSGVTVPMMVAFGADRGSFDTIDIGAKRKVADIYGVNPAVASIGSLFGKLLYGNRYSPTQIGHVIETFAPYVETLLREAPSQVARVTQHAVRAGVVVRMAEGVQDAVSNYYALSLLDFDSMPSSVKSFARQLLVKHSSSQQEVAVRAWRAFGEDRRDNERMVIKNLPIVTREMRDSIEAILNGASALSAAAD